MASSAALAAAVAGCGNDPFSFPWDAVPDTTVLYSLARPELNLNSAYNFNSSAAVRVEAAGATGSWDMAVDTRDGEIVLLPPGALGVSSTARIAPIEGMSFDDVVQAPADSTLYVSADPVPVHEGTIYVVRTGKRTGSFGTSCVYYAKVEPLVIDVAGGTLQFRDVTDPVCNNRNLVPPK